MSSLRYSESVVVACSPEVLYDMVSDVTRMGEGSPVCRACWWDDGDGPRPGAWFTGRNEMPERTWETRSHVVAADRYRPNLTGSAASAPAITWPSSAASSRH